MRSGTLMGAFDFQIELFYILYPHPPLGTLCWIFNWTCWGGRCEWYMSLGSSVAELGCMSCTWKGSFTLQPLCLQRAFFAFYAFNATCPERFELCPALCILVLAGVGRFFLVGDRGWTKIKWPSESWAQDWCISIQFCLQEERFFFSWKDFKFS